MTKFFLFSCQWETLSRLRKNVFRERSDKSELKSATVSHPIKRDGELCAKFGKFLRAVCHTLNQFSLEDLLLLVHFLHQVVDVQANSVTTRDQVLILNT